MGTLKVEEGEMATKPADFKSRKVLGQDPKIFPAAELSFFTVDDNLVPASQDVLRFGSVSRGKSFWDIIVQPGKVWSEAGDDGWNRASFPFALVHSLEGETHNGVAMFLYKGDRVSNLHFQIVQQTAPYYVEDYFTAWGALKMTFDPVPPAALDTLTSTWRAAEEALITAHPWPELEALVGRDRVARFDSEITPSDIVADGLFYQGKFYLKSAPSAAGPLPYADWQRFGVWSVTKALVNATAMFRMAEKYGPEVFSLKLTDYIGELRGVPGWDMVTFGQALNMLTGLGTGSLEINPNDMNDGNIDEFYPRWYEAPTVGDKIAAQAADAKPHPWGPGLFPRYRDFDQFILGVAMDRLLKSREGPQADLWTMMLEEVFKPIGIYYAPINRTLEAEGPGQPLMCYGYYPTFSDMIKIARLYQNGGRVGDRQILNSMMLADTALSDTRVRGRTSGHKYHLFNYNTFWYAAYNATDGRTFYFPFMRGWGRNFVMLFPNDIVGIRLAKDWDGGDQAASLATLAETAFDLAGLK